MYALLDEPDKFDELCDIVANGLTLRDVSMRWQVPYSRLHLWVFDPAYPDRLQAYSRAMEARQSFYTETVLARLMEIGQTTLAACYNPSTGKLLPIHKMPAEAQAAIKTIDATGKVTMTDPIAALTLIGKQHGMFGADMNVRVSGNLTHEMAKAVNIADLSDAELAAVRAGEISNELLERISVSAAAATTPSGG